MAFPSVPGRCFRGSYGFLRGSVMVALGLGLSLGCSADLWAVGPDYNPPEPAAPERWSSTEDAEASDLARHWWRKFGDEDLNRLVERALRQNHTIAIAQGNLRQAQSLARSTASSLWPSADAGASFTSERASQFGTNSLAQLNQSQLPLPSVPDDVFTNPEIYRSTISADWEVDVFGGIRRRRQAAFARSQAAGAGLRETQLDIVAQVCRGYLSLRGSQAREQAVRRRLESISRHRQLMEARERAGLVAKQRTNDLTAEEESARADLHEILAAIARQRHVLAVLVDVTPGKLSELLTLEAGQLPDFPGLPKLISPQELLRNRPDLRRAERELAAATADIGSATAELYPRFFVSGVLGLESLSIEDLVRFDSLMWRLGPQVRWRIFRRRQLQAQVDAAEARHSQAIANYERSVLLALQEVEDALTGLRNHRSRSASLRIATESHRDTADKERARWRSGLTDRGALLRARIQLQRALEKLLASRAESLLSLVDTYRAQGYSLPDSGESQP